MYEETGKTYDLTPEEVQVLLDFNESPEGQLWKRLERTVLMQANVELDTAKDIETILRAQGQKKFYRRREEVLHNIIDTAKLEKEGLDGLVE